MTAQKKSDELKKKRARKDASTATKVVAPATASQNDTVPAVVETVIDVAIELAGTIGETACDAGEACVEVAGAVLGGIGEALG